jgi:hypothetical protein
VSQSAAHRNTYHKKVENNFAGGARQISVRMNMRAKRLDR